MSRTGRRRFGSIRQLGSGRFQVRYRTASGAFVTAPTTFISRAEAERHLAAIETDLERGDWQDPRAASTTVAEWAALWLHGLQVRPNTRRGYEAAVRTHVLPAFGDRRISSVTYLTVRQWVGEMLADGAAPGTVSGARKVLALVLEEAVRQGALKKNPCAGVRVPRGRREEMVYLSIEEVLRLAEAITHPPRQRRQPLRTYPQYGLLVRFAALTGLRAGEIAALRVGRVNARTRRVEVAESASETRDGIVYGPTKNYERRSVPVPAALFDELLDYLSERPADPSAFVFVAPDGGALSHTNFYKRHYKPAVLRAGLPPQTRFHDLRHTCAALLIAEGAHTLAVKERLGHSSITVTMDRYGHLFPSLEAAVTDKLDASYRASVDQERPVVVARKWHDTPDGPVPRKRHVPRQRRDLRKLESPRPASNRRPDAYKTDEEP